MADYQRAAPVQAPAPEPEVTTPAAAGRGNSAEQARLAGEDLEGDARSDLDAMRQHLSYSFLDLAVTDEDVTFVLEKMLMMNNLQLVGTCSALGNDLIDRLLANISAVHTRQYPSVIGRVRGIRNGDPNAVDQSTLGQTTNFAATGTLFVNGISADDVVQGANTADCWFLSVLGSIAGQNPDQIRGMVRENSPGNYSVRFFTPNDNNGYTPVWMTVGADLPTSGGNLTNAYSPDQANGQRELWPSVIERAFARFNGSYGDIQYGSTRMAFEAITGRSGTQVDTSDRDGNATGSSDTQWTSLVDALGRHDAVVCSSGSHAVTVLSASDAGGSRQVVIRNQQAPSVDGHGDGHRTMPWESFRTEYRYFRFGSAAPISS